MKTINYQGKNLEVEFTRDAVAENNGTEGDVRYQQDGVIKGVEVRVYWNTTGEFDDNSKQYKELNNMGAFDQEAQDEFNYLQSYFEDASRFCDWSNPVLITLRDGSDFEL